MSTYIKLFRDIQQWRWYTDGNTARVFVHILLNAKYKPTEYKGYTIEAGQCIFGRKKWAEDLNMSERQVRTAIEHLKSTNEITTKSTNKFTVITVVKWEFWQMGEGYSTNKPTNNESNKRPTNDQQTTTYKEYKNTKNVKNTNLILSTPTINDDEEIEFYEA